MTKLEGHPFENGPTCNGVAYIADAPHDLADIAVRGRYPEEGWARNRDSHEIVRVVRGMGELVLRGNASVELKEGMTVEVKPGTWFAWGGDIDLLMTCSPPFTPEQYEHRSALDALLEDYFPDDAEFASDFDDEDKLGFLYGQLNEQGDDADIIFKRYGITEDSDEI